MKKARHIILLSSIVLSVAGCKSTLATGTPTAIPPTKTTSPTDTPEPTSTPDREAIERQALVTLYEATEGDDWVHNDYWLSNKPICDWYGVKCEGGFVVVLSLSQNALRGKIPPEISQLTSLRYLDISYNGLTSLPPELARIPTLSLACNAFVELSPELEAIAIAEEMSLSSHWAGIPPCQGNEYAGGPLYIPADATLASTPSN